jgi:hypothetical protein
LLPAKVFGVSVPVDIFLPSQFFGRPSYSIQMVHCVTGFLLMRLFSPWRIKFFVHRMPHIHPATNAPKRKTCLSFLLGNCQHFICD